MLEVFYEIHFHNIIYAGLDSILLPKILFYELLVFMRWHYSSIICRFQVKLRSCFTYTHCHFPIFICFPQFPNHSTFMAHEMLLVMVLFHAYISQPVSTFRTNTCFFFLLHSFGKWGACWSKAIHIKVCVSVCECVCVFVRESHRDCRKKRKWQQTDIRDHQLTSWNYESVLTSCYWYDTSCKLLTLFINKRDRPWVVSLHSAD